MRKPVSSFDSLSLEFFKRGEELEAQFLREAREALDESAWWEPAQLAEGTKPTSLPQPRRAPVRARRGRALLVAGGLVLVGAVGFAVVAGGDESATAAADDVAPMAAAPVPTVAEPPKVAVEPAAAVAAPPPAAVAPTPTVDERAAPVVSALPPAAAPAPTVAEPAAPVANAAPVATAVAERAPPVVERKQRRKARAKRKVVRNRERAIKHYRSGADAFKRGDVAGAGRAFRASLRADDRYAPAYRGLGLVHRRADRTTSAVRAFRAYLRVAPRARDRPQIEAVIRSLQSRSRRR